MDKKPPYIEDKRLYAAVMKVCEETRKSGAFEAELRKYAKDYRVDIKDLRKHARFRLPISLTKSAEQRVWSREEENRLKQEFQAGMTVEEMSERHRRMPASIAAKLVRLGCVESRNQVAGYKEHKKTRKSR